MERLRALLLLVLVFAVVPDVCPQSLNVSPPIVTFACTASKPQVIPASSERKTWPWMALLGYRSAEGTKWNCAGMLINHQWVLTHAVCSSQLKPTVVRLGEYDYNDDLDGANHEDFLIEETVNYPDYVYPKATHGLMLIKLSSRVAFQRYIRPVCLPWGEESRRNITGNKALLFTFGNTLGDPNIKSVQREIEMTVFSTAHCDRSYSTRNLGEETLCAGDPAGGKDHCTGDGGAPLVTLDGSGRHVVAGIVSEGSVKCGDKDFPGLYLNLRYPPYLAWIKSVAFTRP